METSVPAADSRAGLRKPALTRAEIVLAGAVGAFAPQILRWYAGSGFGDLDPVVAAGHAVVVLLFLALAGYVTLLWGVRTLREAFLVGLAVPSIVLGPGGDLAALARPGGASAQMRVPPARVATDARPAVGALDLRVRAEDGGDIERFSAVATDGRSRTYATESGYLPLPAGPYRLQVSAPGHETLERQVLVSPRQSTDVYVTLRRLSPAQRFLKGAAQAIDRY